MRGLRSALALDQGMRVSILHQGPLRTVVQFVTPVGFVFPPHDHAMASAVHVGCRGASGMPFARLRVMIDEPIKDDPRKEDLPTHHGVDDPGKKPPASDPAIRKGPLVDPPTKPSSIDPPFEPHVPGEPEKKVEDPPAPGAPEAPAR